MGETEPMTDAERIEAMRNRIRDLQLALQAQARALNDCLQQIFDGDKRSYDHLRHVGACARRRAFNVAEDVFAARWEQECRRVTYLNGNRGALELLLNTIHQADEFCDRTNQMSVVSQRDAMVAATIIQWLGTNCGQAFLSECAREIKQRDAVAAAAQAAGHEKSRELRTQRSTE